MTVYDGRTPIGTVQDFTGRGGPGRVLAHVREPNGKFTCLGWFATRKEAREAVEARYRATHPPPPEAA